MPAGKLALRGGVGFRPHVPDGISIRSLQRYAKPRAKITDPREVEKLENDLCFAFRRYITYRAAIAPTATERRKMLTRIKTSATRLVSARNRPNAWGLLDALDAPDHGTRDLVYRVLRTNPLLFKQRLRHWASASAGDPLAMAVTIETANRLAGLDIEGLVPESGRFPDPALASLVKSLIPVWKKVTGRSALPTKADDTDAKKSLFADWLGETHGLMGIAAPSLWSVTDIVRRHVRETK